MKPIHAVAIDALNKFRSKVNSEEWRNTEGYDLYKSWVELRRHNQHFIMQPHEWYININQKIDEAIQTYSNPITRKNIIPRSYFVDSSNLHLAIHIMGGFKESRRWEPYINIMVTT